MASPVESMEKRLQDLDYTREEVEKNLLLLEGHLKNYPCPSCMRKHSLIIEALAEEGIGLALQAEDRELYEGIAGEIVEFRARINSPLSSPDHMGEGARIRELRKQIEGLASSSNPGDDDADPLPVEITLEEDTVVEHFGTHCHEDSLRTVIPAEGHLMRVCCPQGHQWNGDHCEGGTEVYSLEHPLSCIDEVKALAREHSIPIH